MPGRRAFVTGGSRGVGLAVAGHLRGEGWSVVTFARSGADITGDVADPAALEAALAVAAAGPGAGLDLLVCCASAAAGGPVREMPTEALIRIAQTDLIGAMLTVKAALPHLAGRPGATIALVSSMASFHGIPGFAAYSACKAAINHFAEALRLEEPDIAVITVILGTIAEAGESARPNWSTAGPGTLARSRRFRFFAAASEPIAAAHVAAMLYASLGRSGTLYLPSSLRWMDRLARLAPGLFRLCVRSFQRRRLPAILGHRD